MKKISKFKVLVPALACMLSLTTGLLTGCGDEKPKEEPVAHVHSVVEVNGTEANCTDTGTQKHWHCAGCNKDFQDENATTEATTEWLTIAVDTTKHVYDHSKATYVITYNSENNNTYICTATTACEKNGEHAKDTATAIATLKSTTKEATCTTTGTGTFEADFTDKTYGTDGKVTVGNQNVIPAKGHSNVTKTEAKAATCTTNGNKEYYTCANESGVYYKNEACTEKYTDTDSYVIPATGNHSVSTYSYNYSTMQYEGTCSGCNSTITKAAGTQGSPYLAKDVATLKGAINAVKANGGYITLTENITLNEQISLMDTTSTTAKAVYLNLGGKTLTNNKGKTDGSFIYVEGYNLTVTNGKISMGATEEQTEETYSNIFQVEGTRSNADTTLNLVSAEGASLTVINSCGASNVLIVGEKATLNTNAVLTSTGNESYRYAVIQGYGDEAGKGVKAVNVTGGTIKNEKGLAMYIPNTGTYSISNATIKGTTAVYIKCGILNISGTTTLESTLTATTPYYYDNEGWFSTGEALIIDSCGYVGASADNFKVNIEGTSVTFTTAITDGKGIANYTRNYSDGSNKGTNLNVTITANSTYTSNVNAKSFTTYTADNGKRSTDEYQFASLNLGSDNSCTLYVYNPATKTCVYCPGTYSISGNTVTVTWTNAKANGTIPGLSSPNATGDDYKTSTFTIDTTNYTITGLTFATA